MDEELTWHIGKEGIQGERLDIPPYKAYFYWKRNGQIVNSAELTKEELKNEIVRRQKAGESIGAFKQALKRLQESG